LLIGCAERPPAPESPSQSASSASPGATDFHPTKAASGTDGDSPRQAIEIRSIDEKDLAQLLAQRRGKVALVDFWATWCLPCVDLLPHTVELHRDLSQRGLDVILVSLDDPESEGEVFRVLISKGVRFDAFISRYGTSPRSMEAFGIPDGSLPHLRLYDRQGRERQAFNAGQFQAADIDRVVKELLDQP